MLIDESILATVGTRLTDDLRKAQVARGLKASGKSAASLQVTVERTGAVVTLTLTGAPYWRFQQSGRGPSRSGKPSRLLIQQIQDWIRVKRLSIPLSAAGAIAAKIAREGITVPNRFNKGGVLSEPLAKTRVTSLLKPDLQARYLSAIKSQLFS